jgi:hypothetical protein
MMNVQTAKTLRIPRETERLTTKARRARRKRERMKSAAHRSRFFLSSFVPFVPSWLTPWSLCERR